MKSDTSVLSKKSDKGLRILLQSKINLRWKVIILGRVNGAVTPPPARSINLYSISISALYWTLFCYKSSPELCLQYTQFKPVLIDNVHTFLRCKCTNQCLSRSLNALLFRFYKRTGFDSSHPQSHSLPICHPSFLTSAVYGRLKPEKKSKLLIFRLLGPCAMYKERSNLTEPIEATTINQSDYLWSQITHNNASSLLRTRQEVGEARSCVSGLIKFVTPLQFYCYGFIRLNGVEVICIHRLYRLCRTMAVLLFADITTLFI